MTKSLNSSLPQTWYHALEQWRADVNRAARGKDFDQTMFIQHEDGFELRALYGPKPANALNLREKESPPTVTSWISATDPIKAAAQIRTELEGGSNSVIIPISVRDGGNGVLIGNITDMAKVLGDTDIINDRLVIEAGADTQIVQLLVAAYLTRRNIPLNLTRLELSFSPSDIYRQPLKAEQKDGILNEQIQLSSHWLKEGYDGVLVRSDGTYHHNCGASPAMELAATLAETIDLWRRLDEQGHSLTQWMSRTVYRLSFDQSFFQGIAKGRAFRAIHALALDAMGLPPHSPTVRGMSSRRMLTRVDTTTNILRNAAATVSAIIAGVDSFITLPHSDYDSSEGFAARMARNAQLIAVEEAHIAKVTDPAAGSGYLETFTNQLSEQAWRKFQEIEDQGGYISACNKGWLQSRIAIQAEQRQANINSGQTLLTGVTAFPSLDFGISETIEETSYDTKHDDLASAFVLNLSKNDVNATISAICSGKPLDAIFARRTNHVDAKLDDEKLYPTPQPISLDQSFYELRLNAKIFERNNNRHPAVFLARLGTPADYSARSNFTQNLMAAGGISVNPETNVNSLSNLDHEFTEFGANIAIICGSDSQYEAEAEKAIQQLINADCKHIWIAGKLNKLKQQFDCSSIEDCIFQGQNLLETLQKIHAILDIEPAPKSNDQVGGGKS